MFTLPSREWPRTEPHARLEGLMRPPARAAQRDRHAAHTLPSGTTVTSHTHTRSRATDHTRYSLCSHGTVRANNAITALSGTSTHHVTLGVRGSEISTCTPGDARGRVGRPCGRPA